MTKTSNSGADFINQVNTLVLENISNEQFGVSELAELMNMSRSNLLRKIKKQTQLSASQFIRQVRLQKGMEMVKEDTLTISEISYQVGFGSASYFIKCFREHYGYPPGEVFNLDKSDGVAPKQQRQLVAIMFTDIKGYTALMQEDEKKAIAYRDLHRKIFDFTTNKFGGRILQYYGDGTLSIFTSAIAAVQCGIEMQLAFRKEKLQIPMRVGIHSGDIIVTDQDIIGDAVNIAARIESLAKIGSVYISEKVYDEIKNQAGLFTTSMGVHTLKNVTKPMKVYNVFNHELGHIDRPITQTTERSEDRSFIKWLILAFAIICFVFFAYTSKIFNKESAPDSLSKPVAKSIAVLPFKNESSDSMNLYFVNGLMESALNKLQKIGDLRVISRTSVEKYRNTNKGIPEIAEELNVNYLVEGSGQRVGDQVLLNIQLIEASSDQQIWVEQYNREVVDVFALQNDVAKEIVRAIKVIVTPSELEQIEKRPTENLLAYEYYLQALDLFYSRPKAGWEKAIPLFEQAIEEDPEFALAYANIAISYYLLEMSQIEKQYTEKINIYADKALLYDSKSAESLIAKAFYYVQTNEYQLALPHYRKALEYNPNSNLAVQMLADFYFRLKPDTDKYLEYALKGAQLNVASDSITQSYVYLQLSNALVSSGFIDEALGYINMSLGYSAENYFAPHLKAIIEFIKDGNLERTRNSLIKEWNKDANRLDILQDVAKFYYLEENYDSAYVYFEKFVKAREDNGLNIYRQENIKIAEVYKKMGLNAEAEILFNDYVKYCEEDQSIYRSVNLVWKYVYEENFDEAIEQLKVFSEVENYPYWFLLIEDEPMIKRLQNHPEFEQIMQKIKDRFWENQTNLRESLEDKGLI
ncbi:MAG: helix-turn-helix domain-containing protein [Saprospiraceae bacterium]|nr:helix-turn-helix domain-containing protein [Saprospiraceae bacterium]